MMRQEFCVMELSSLSLNNDRYQVIRLRYKDKCCFSIVRSEKLGCGDLNALLNSVERVDELEGNGFHLVAKDLLLPNFELKGEYDIRSLLEKLNINFSAEEALSAPFLLDTRGKHMAVIEVDENGTRAAGCSYVVADGPSRTIEINGPFVFYIKNLQDNVVLFTGIVNALPNAE
ncbi:Plasma serine protease inhibitor-like protein [Dinothrombium tinctorium]|uniref:Plasma serine protease inhibitor-like protein n=1 Tax=Dinothrombium tinctorium TaxID=1965070 RepID=A0A443Q6N5_9ACAR|nr:Plasma serine protease inhibitor-like protein [Dinothrombium tinctorium]